MPSARECPICGAGLGPARIAAPDRLQGTPGHFEVAACPRCGAGRTLPAVAPEELAAFYPEQYGPYGGELSGVLGLVSRAIRGWQGRRAWRSEPLTALRERPPGRAVDVGCGRGDLAAALAARGWRMAGVEPSREAAAIAAERGIDARAGTLATVELEEGAYDAAIFHHSLEHVLDPVADLRTVARALRPGGLVLITVPHFASWQARRFRGRWFHLDLPRHRVHFTAEALAHALAEAGLEPVRLGTSTSAVGLPGSVQYALGGRCLFPGGLALRVAGGLCALAWPLARALDRRAGGGDVLHAVARKPATARRQGE